MKRAIRRAAMERRKAQVVELFRRWAHGSREPYRIWMNDPSMIGKWAAVRKLCSCWMCRGKKYDRRQEKSGTTTIETSA